MMPKNGIDREKVMNICFENNIKVTREILSCNYDDVRKIIQICKKEKINTIPSNIFFKTPNEVEEILKICNNNKIPRSGAIFYNKPADLKKIITMCKKNGIKPNSQMLMKKPEYIKKIIDICQENDIELNPYVFTHKVEGLIQIIELTKNINLNLNYVLKKRTTKEILEILKVCIENTISISKELFNNSSSNLKLNIKYIKDYLGKEYLKTVLLMQKHSKLRAVTGYLIKNNLMGYIKNRESIFDMSPSLIERKRKKIEKLGKNIVENDKMRYIIGYRQGFITL